MYLADKDISKMITDHDVIKPFVEKKLGSVAYDLTIKSIIDPTKRDEHDQYTLKPGQTVFVSSEEVISMPNDYIGVIISRNSTIRLGLTIDAPVYQPGHKTRVFMRVTNLTLEDIELSNGKSIASIMFEKLSTEPKKIYDGTFSNEFDYSGLGKYHAVDTPTMAGLKKK